MKKLTQQIAAVALVSLLVALSTRAAESLSVLLQKGIFAEETEGNLDAAIKIYEGIVKEGEANRSLVAQAQYRLGACELKRGKKDQAEAAFRKILGQFSDQAEISSKARERLGELGKSVSSVVVRQVWSGKEAAGDCVSPDGRYLAFIDWDTGNLAVRDLANGQTRRLTDTASWEIPVQYAESCAFSRDGKRIAYSWYKGSGPTNYSYQVRIVGLEDSKSRGLGAQKTNGRISVQDWSPDGRAIAVFDYEMRGINGLGGISLVSLDDGAMRKVSELSGGSSALRFSPDGRYLACNLARPGRTGPRAQSTNDIIVVDVKDGLQKRVVENVSGERFMGWAPHGLEIIFCSDRRGTTDLWSRKIEEPEAPSFPRLLKADLGDIQPIGLTPQGAFFYSSEVGTSKEFYTAFVDFEAGKVVSVSKPIKTLFQPTGMVSNKAVRSADKRFLYFFSGYKEPAAYILDVDSGAERELENSRKWASRVGWWWPSREPNNRRMFVSLFGSINEGGLYQVNLQTGEMSPVALHGPGVRQIIDNPIRFSSDDTFLVFGRLYSNSNKFVLVKHDFKSNRETEHEIPGLAAHPIPIMPQGYRNRAMLLADGRTFLFNRKQESTNSYALIHHDLVSGSQKEFSASQSPIGVVDTFGDDRVFVVTTDERKRSVFSLVLIENAELRQSHQVTVPDGFQYRGQHWGEPHLILIKPKGNEEGDLGELWTLSVRSGELKSLGLSVPNDQFFGLKAGAKSLNFQMTASGTRDIWVLENFLPPVAAAK